MENNFKRERLFTVDGVIKWYLYNCIIAGSVMFALAFKTYIVPYLFRAPVQQVTVNK